MAYPCGCRVDPAMLLRAGFVRALAPNKGIVATDLAAQQAKPFVITDRDRL
jgi:hypothetical protein